MAVGTAFRMIFKECVLEAFSQVLGQNGTQAVLFHLDSSSGLDDPAQLHERLHRLFGGIGARSLERQVLEHLADRMNDASLRPQDDFDFKATVAKARALSVRS